MTEKKQLEVDAIDAEVFETGTEGTQAIVPPTTAGGTDIEAVAGRIDALVSAHNKIRTALLKLALPGDWVIFGEDGKEVAELTGAGAFRIASTVGISFTNWEARKETGTDDKGDWYRWEFECDAGFRWNVVRALGRAGSRDKFFGKSHGELKTLSEISEGDIKMAARRAAMKEGVKILLGLHHIPLQVLKELNVPLAYAKNITFQKTPPKSAEQVNSEEKLRREIVDMAKEIIAITGEKDYTSVVEFCSRFEKDGKSYAHKDVNKLSGKWLNFTHHKVKEELAGLKKPEPKEVK
jgi:hypothetical protein